MKHLYLFFSLLSYLSFAQANQFQLELVDENIGASLTVPPEFGNDSNDDGLNQIFQLHNVGQYEIFYPDTYLPEPYFSQPGRFYYGVCDCNIQDLIDDLNAYTGVVKYATEFNMSDNYTPNVLNLTLMDPNVGVPVGFDDEIVTTNDAGLNTIFTDNNVRTYGSELGFNFYALVCSCDAVALKQELDNYAAVINTVTFVNTIFLLSTEEQNIEEVEVTPNPFYDHLTIKTEVPLKSIILYDVLGKTVMSSTNKNDFESRVTTIKAGIYLLRMTDVNDNSATKKIIKQ